MSINNDRVIIAVDVMSGDKGISELIPAIIGSLDKHPHLYILAVGNETLIKAELNEHKYLINGRIKIQNATEIVKMDDSPQSALKNKKDSSMRVAINAVKNKEAMACISAGNTGALMATARFVLKMMPGIERPAICTAIPSVASSYGHVHMLDLGANVDIEPKHLYQFAVMGSLLAGAVNNQEAPKVGLLNIGSEAIKGNELVKGAAGLLQDSALNYIGFVEGDGLFFDDVDVVVCDGFAGNVALKTLEGTCRLIARLLENAYKKNLLTMMAGLVSLPVIKDLKRQVDPRNYNGASLLGLKGLVIKSHGNADRISFENAISISVKLVEQNVLQKIEEQFSNVINVLD